MQNKGKKMKTYIWTSLVTVMLMASYLQADTATKEPVCKTTSECDKLTEHLKAEIDGLKLKGFKNLTDDEFDKYANLKKELLAALKAKSARQDEIIAEEKAKTAEAYLKVSKKLDELSGMVK